MAPIPLKAKPLISDTDDEKAKNGDLKNPVDRKIEELLRKSLKNLREGSHPLRLSNSKIDNSDSSFSNPRKTQDDMAIDPQIYSRKTPLNGNHSMDLDNKIGLKDAATKTTQKNNLQIPRFRIKRSNSLPGGLDMTESTNVAMDMDGWTIDRTQPFTHLIWNERSKWIKLKQNSQDGSKVHTQERYPRDCSTEDAISHHFIHRNNQNCRLMVIDQNGTMSEQCQE